MKKIDIFIAVMIPPGGESKVALDWDKDEHALKTRCLKCKKYDEHLRVEILKVVVEL